jgi:hypothetical protein
MLTVRTVAAIRERMDEAIFTWWQFLWALEPERVEQQQSSADSLHQQSQIPSPS